MQYGKYFRILADVYVYRKNLANSLIQSGHVMAYDGTNRLYCPSDVIFDRIKQH